MDLDRVDMITFPLLSYRDISELVGTCISEMVRRKLACMPILNHIYLCDVM